MNDEQKTKVESIVFKKLIEHLQNRTDVQNIDLMNLSGFCRNCLSRWYSEAAEETGLKVDKDHAREIVYGMPHSVWKQKYQTDADEDQKNKFKNSIKIQNEIKRIRNILPYSSFFRSEKSKKIMEQVEKINNEDNLLSILKKYVK